MDLWEEDEDMRIADNIPEQRAWRTAFANEEQDDGWTAEVQKELEHKARTVLEDELQVALLSCRETVCRMFLTFNTSRDARAFQDAPHAPDLHYEYQDLSPELQHQDTGRSSYSYELMIHRQRETVVGARDHGAQHDSRRAVIGEEVSQVLGALGYR
ncbi:MAG: hypothetical protein OXR73_32160 [Myxococcales bacterium]|nr:hypothetical protein [Myxococcales bacterium]